ncbi:MAG: hypothetical protein QM528_03115 [Phycisphaerales bacterium]|nr:hypothetical protein [Phycisphaerales bacterium]MDI9357922.1 hypothetical protein [Phycisphaerales bacterium]
MKRKFLSLGSILNRHELRSEALKLIQGGYKCHACVGFGSVHTYCHILNSGNTKCCSGIPGNMTFNNISYYGCVTNGIGCDDGGSTPSAICFCWGSDNYHLCT